VGWGNTAKTLSGQGRSVKGRKRKIGLWGRPTQIATIIWIKKKKQTKGEERVLKGDTSKANVSCVRGWWEWGTFGAQENITVSL